jgi:hypothetical protein
MRSILIFVFLFLVSCATQKVEEFQQENCYQYITFPEFHRCSEKVVKSTYSYRLSFERDIIDQYFAFGEVLALQVEKKTKDNIEAFEIWGDELDKAVRQAELRGKEAAEITIITAALAVTAYIIYKESRRIKEFKKLENSASSTVNKVAGTTSSYTPNSGVAACRVGLLINRVQGTRNNLMNNWC